MGLFSESRQLLSDKRGVSSDVAGWTSVLQLQSLHSSKRSICSPIGPGGKGFDLIVNIRVQRVVKNLVYMQGQHFE